MSQRLFVAAALLAVSTFASSCTGKSTADRGASAQPVGTTAPAPGAAPPGAEAPAAASANTAPAPADASTPTITGPVVETMNASSYTYVRVKTSTGDVWAASSQFPVAVGDRVVVRLETPMANFHSKTLNRDFPMIYFASRIDRQGEAPSTTPPAMALGHAPDAGPQEASGTGVRVTPPVGAITIAQVWAERKSLAGKTVTVRGKVVKFNGGILDRNWIHLQDGTGQAADGTNDLLVTSSQAAKVGDVITATGQVAVDQDFTAGYAYKVLVEKATLK